MTNRRQFLGLGLAASVWPVVGSGRTARPGAGAARLYVAVCDRRYIDAAAFAAPLRAQAVPVREIDGDVTSLWYHDLALRWRDAPVPIVGLTTPEALFCLEQLAWDHRMHVVFRAERVGAADGRIVRRVAAPARVIVSQSRPARAGAARCAAWAAEAPRHAALEPAPRTVLEVPAERGDGGEAWVAWAIGPVRRS